MEGYYIDILLYFLFQYCFVSNKLILHIGGRREKIEYKDFLCAHIQQKNTLILQLFTIFLYICLEG